MDSNPYPYVTEVILQKPENKMRNHSTNLKHYSTISSRLAAPLMAAVALALLLATFWLAAPAYAQGPVTNDGDIGIASFPGATAKSSLSATGTATMKFTSWTTTAPTRPA